MGNHKGLAKIAKDNIHYNTRHTDIYNKPFNFVISPREPGKSTAVTGLKVFDMWLHHHRPSLIIRRRIADMDESYIADLIKPVNKFRHPYQRLTPVFKKTDIKSGIVDVYIEDNKGVSRFYCRVQALSIPNARGKSRVIEDLGLIVFDEYLINPMQGEKYLDGELTAFRELYNTYYRDARDRGHQVKCWFLGNPYTVFNPFHLWLQIPLSKIKSGCFLVGPNWTFEAVKLSKALKKRILETNPLYAFTDEYKQYAFGGAAIADTRFQIQSTRPYHAKLSAVIHVSTTYLLIWKAGDADDYSYWVEATNKAPHTNRHILAADFNSLVEGTKLMTATLKPLFVHFKFKMGTRQVAFQTLEAAYLIESIWAII